MQHSFLYKETKFTFFYKSYTRYSLGRTISLIVFTKSCVANCERVLQTFEKGIFYSAVLVRGRYFFTQGEIMEEKDVLAFKLACQNYFFTLSLQALRSYGRALRLQKPAALKKGDLIEEIIKVLCGEVSPQRNGNRGAPVKCDYLDERIFEKVESLQKEYLYGESLVKPLEESPPILPEPKEENNVEPLQFTVRFSLLNEEQKRLFLTFLDSL